MNIRSGNTHDICRNINWEYSDQLMAQTNVEDVKSSKLRITGIKEPIVWLKDDKDNRPKGWMAGVGIAGLIPDLIKGYRHRYTRELISPDGEIVNTGILSQAPGYLATSTTVAIGGKGLSSGSYTVRVWADNGEEDYYDDISAGL